MPSCTPPAMEEYYITQSINFKTIVTIHFQWTVNRYTADLKQQ